MSIFEPIIEEIKTKPTSINFKFKTSEEIKKFEFARNDYTEEESELYYEAKSLTPFGEYEIPDQNFRSLSKNFNFGYSKGQYFYNTEYMKRTKLDNTYTKLVEYQNITGAISFNDNEFFEKFLSINKNYKAVFLTPTLIVSSVENFINYRERNSHLSYDDTIYYFELKHYITKQYKPTPEDIRENFKKIYPSVNYQVVDENICQYQNLTKYIRSIKGKLDLVCFDSTIYEWENREISGYLSCQLIFNILILAFSKLKKGGIINFKIRNIDNYLILDILTLLTKYFDHVYIFKGTLTSPVVFFKEIICKGFTGFDKDLLASMITTSDKWLEVHPDCGLRVNKKSKTFVKSILNYDYNITGYLDYFNTFETKLRLEAWKKIIENYYYVKEKGEAGKEELLLKQMRNSLTWLEKHNIETKAKYKVIDHKIIDEDMKLNFEDLKFDIKGDKSNKSEKKNRERKTTKQDLNTFLIKLGILSYTYRMIELLDKKEYNQVYQKVKKLTIPEEYKIQEIQKIFDPNKDDIIELDLLVERKNIISKIDKLSQKYEKCYLYKSLLTIYDSKLYFIGLDKGKNNKKNNNFFPYLVKLVDRTIMELERNIFYYENYAMLQDNKEFLVKLQKRNDKDWKDKFASLLCRYNVIKDNTKCYYNIK